MLLQAEALVYSILKESAKRSIFKTQQQSCERKLRSDLPYTQGIGWAIDNSRHDQLIVPAYSINLIGALLEQLRKGRGMDAEV